MYQGILSGILGVLIVAAIIYFMMRKGGGCCGHSHGEHHEPGEDSSGKSNTLTLKDPVCGMAVEKDKAAGTAEYKGKTYYFCAAGCRESFEKEPEKYLDATTVVREEKHGCCG